MSDLPAKAGRMIGIENISIGNDSSRVSAAIFFLLCFIPLFATVLFGAVDNMTWIIISILCAVLVFLWLVEAWKARGLIFNPSALQLPLIGIFVIGLIQLLPLGSQPVGGGLTIEAARSISLDPYTTRFFLGHLAILFIFFAACLTFINTELRLKKIVFLIVVFGGVMSFVAIIARLADPTSIYGLRVPFQAMPFGPFVNTHHFAAFVEMTGGLTLSLLLGGTAKERKFLLIIALVIMVTAMIMTSSRGGMLSFVSLATFVGLFKLANRRSNKSSLRQKLIFAGGTLATIVVVILLVVFVGGDQSLIRGVGLGGQEEVSSGRFHFWSVAIKIFLAHPIIGAGLDAFGVAFTRYDTWNGLLRVEQAHNDYLQMLADAGILGLGCVIAFIYLLFRKSLAMISSVGDGFRKDAAVGALAGCLGVLIHSFFDFPLRSFSNSFVFLLLAAVATVAVKTSDEKPEAKRRSRSTSRSQ